MTDNKILDRVRRLLAKAESPACTPEESETYNAKAAELIAQYGIEQALLANAGAVRDDITDKKIVIPAPYSFDKALLFNAVARPLRLRVIRVRSFPSEGSVTKLHIFGYASDIERAELLFTSLLLQAANGIARPTPEYGESVVSWRKAFFAGFSDVVRRRLKESEARAAASVPEARTGDVSTALVLKTREQRVVDACRCAYPNQTSGRRTYRRYSSGGAAGRAAGERADIGGARFGSHPAGRALR